MHQFEEFTHNGPEYMVGSGETIDLFILLIRPCISYSQRKIESMKPIVVGKAIA